MYWGIKTKINAIHDTSVLEVPKPIQLATNLHFDGSNSLYVRLDYKTLYGYLDGENDAEQKGVVVTGSPGVGKSFFNIYALARRLTECKTTFYRVNPSSCWVFDRFGVWNLPFSAPISALELMLPVERSEDFIWCLYDSNDQAEPFTPFQSDACFLVQTTSPNHEKYFNWTKQAHRRASFWFMEPWNYNELCEGLRLHKLTVTKSAYNTIGPCIRDHIGGKELFMNNVLDAVSEIKDVSTFIAAVNSKKATSSDWRMVSHRIFYIMPAENRRNCLVDFKSMAVARLFSERHGMSFTSHAETLCRLYSNVPQAGILRGWIFENLAISYTSGAVADTLGEFIDTKWEDMEEDEDAEEDEDMEEDEGTEESEDMKEDLDGNEGEDGEELMVEALDEAAKDKGLTHRFVSTAKSKDRLPLKDRLIHRYRTTREISIDDKYYVPEPRNNSLFDAIFFDLQSGKVVVWVLQITTGARHKGSNKGYSILERIQKKARAHVGEGGEVEFRYVLVMPAEKSANAAWKLPADQSPPTRKEPAKKRRKSTKKRPEHYARWIPGKVHVQGLKVPK
ncbi:hypothetical protein VKT23_017611 [Stygiomarasmius scandens]|uniref:Uncharacterized protein n=1 Tax=Marasmiellus scandens TaxID=2682957 RepID=A0ABR1IV24_9AGAR